MRPTRNVVIVGSGFCGTMAAAHLLRKGLGADLRVTLVEQHANFCRGVAYGVSDDNLLLNVPAGNMSAFPDDPGHFVTFCQSIDPAFNAGAFVSRRIYGEYLEDTLRQAEQQSDSSLVRVGGEVTCVKRATSGNGYVISISNGTSMHADRVVLALGHFPSVAPIGAADQAVSDCVIDDPWDFSRIDRLAGDAPVIILGTGHTAVDVLFRLTTSGFKRKIFLLSRNGMLPHAHRPAPTAPQHSGFPAHLQDVPPTIRSLTRVLRQESRLRQAIGHDWRDVLNELRPHTAAVWQRLPVTEQRRFLSKLSPHWNIHRHRLAPTTHRRLQRLLESGQVQVIRGHLRKLDTSGLGLMATIDRRDGRDPVKIAVGSVINCTGPNYNIQKIVFPLITQLRIDGLIRQDVHKIGLEVTPAYELVDESGHPNPGLYYLGPMLRARYWEAIAVPELRIHARLLADELMAGIKANIVN